MQIKGIQILGVLVAVVFLFQTYSYYKTGKFKKSDLILWSLGSFALIVLSLFPIVTSGVLTPFLMGRGLDAFLVIGLLGAYGILFRTYVRIEETNREITELTRKIALKFKEKK